MFRRLKPYLSKYKGLLIGGFVLVILKSLFQSAGPQIIKETIDSIAPGTDMSGFLFYQKWVSVMQAQFALTLVAAFILCYLITETLSAIFLYLMRQTLIVMSRKIEYDLRSDTFSHIQKMELSFFQYTKTGDIMSRMTNDLANVREVLGPGIMYTANTIVSFFFILPMMVTISPKLTLFAFLPLIVLSFAIQQLSGMMMSRSQRVQEKLSDISSAVQENFSGIRVVKSFVLENLEILKFKKLSEDYVTLNLDAVKVRGIMMSSVILTIGMSVATLLWLGGREVMSGDMTIGQFTAFNFFLIMLIWPIVAVGWVINIFQRGSVSMKRLNEILDRAPAITDKNAEKIDTVRGSIEFRHLNFGFNGEPILKDISFVIKQGTTVGIVGATGSGKSLLVNLIARLYEAPEDTIFIDSKTIRHIPLDTLRQNIGMVMQDNFLFSDTIRNNILFGRFDADEEKMRWSGDIAQLHGNILDFPEKYETIIGERGITLSGGQKQRLAIARAVIREPKILILDDALSSVDTQTEESILTGLKTLMKDRTTILVSHRVHTVKSADMIFVLEDGALIERGAHDELLALGGYYAQLYQRQTIEEEVEAFN